MFSTLCIKFLFIRKFYQMIRYMGWSMAKWVKAHRSKVPQFDPQYCLFSEQALNKLSCLVCEMIPAGDSVYALINNILFTQSLIRTYHGKQAIFMKYLRQQISIVIQVN